VVKTVKQGDEGDVSKKAEVIIKERNRAGCILQSALMGETERESPAKLQDADSGRQK